MRKRSAVWALSALLCLVSCVKNPSGNSHIKRASVASEGHKKKLKALKPLVVQSASLHFTAYKTTAKVGVRGVFTRIQTGLLNREAGVNLSKSIRGMTFSIPFSSLDTKDVARNGKILQYFFHKLAGKAEITGSFGDFDPHTGKGVITVYMNGVSHDLPVAFSRDANVLEFIGTMHLAKWKALRALASLNRACYELHKGADGISKTWSEVKIHGKIAFANYE